MNVSRAFRMAILLGFLGGAAVLPVACTTSPTGTTISVSPSLITDGELIDATLTTLTPLLPLSAQALASPVETAIASGLTALQGGTMTAAQFAALVEGDIKTLGPELLASLGASTLAGVVTALGTLATELVTGVPASSTAATAPDPRPVLRAFVAAHKK